MNWENIAYEYCQDGIMTQSDLKTQCNPYKNPQSVLRGTEELTEKNSYGILKAQNGQSNL